MLAKDAVLDIYVCPKCQATLYCSHSRKMNVDSLTCAKGHEFAVIGGLPIFVESDGYAASFGFQWQAHARDQLDSATGASLSHDRFFRGTHWPHRMPGELILEAGCGSGRFTEVLLSTGARICSFDYSAAAAIAHGAFSSRGAAICQASIYEMPYRLASFDRVFCFGVLQHCPDVRKAFLAVAQMIRPGGHLAIDIYDRRRMWLNARYRVRWLTKRINKQRLHRWCEKIVPLYAKVMPPLHPWNQLLFPIKDYRGALPGLSRAQELQWSVLDTFDALSPEYDQPQYLSTLTRWANEAGLVDIEAGYGGNGIELRARQPASSNGPTTNQPARYEGGGPSTQATAARRAWRGEAVS